MVTNVKTQAIVPWEVFAMGDSVAAAKQTTIHFLFVGMEDARFETTMSQVAIDVCNAMTENPTDEARKTYAAINPVVLQASVWMDIANAIIRNTIHSRDHILARVIPSSNPPAFVSIVPGMMIQILMGQDLALAQAPMEIHCTQLRCLQTEIARAHFAEPIKPVPTEKSVSRAAAKKILLVPVIILQAVEQTHRAKLIVRHLIAELDLPMLPLPARIPAA